MKIDRPIDTSMNFNNNVNNDHSSQDHSIGSINTHIQNVAQEYVGPRAHHTTPKTSSVREAHPNCQMLDVKGKPKETTPPPVAENASNSIDKVDKSHSSEADDDLASLLGGEDQILMEYDEISKDFNKIDLEANPEKAISINPENLVIVQRNKEKGKADAKFHPNFNAEARSEVEKNGFKANYTEGGILKHVTIQRDVIVVKTQTAHEINRIVERLDKIAQKHFEPLRKEHKEKNNNLPTLEPAPYVDQNGQPIKSQKNGAVNGLEKETIREYERHEKSAMKEQFELAIGLLQEDIKKTKDKLKTKHEEAKKTFTINRQENAASNVKKLVEKVNIISSRPKIFYENTRGEVKKRLIIDKTDHTGKASV